MSYRRLLPIIALLSGWCGIAYELLYSRLLTTHLGDMFQVNAAILTSFLLGIGLGAWVSHRFVRWLWLVELGIGIYAVFLETRLVGTLPGFVLAHTVLAVPFVLVAVGASLEMFDKRLELAAASLGAGRWTIFRTVTLPLIAPGVLSGLLFAFATSFDEIIVSLFITSPYLKTLPVQIFSSITRDADPTVAAVGTILLLATSVLIGGGLFLLGRGQGRGA